MDRIEKLFALLPEEIDSVLITSPVNRRYFTGFASSAGVVLATRERACFLTDFRYIEAAKQRVQSCECIMSGNGNTVESLAKKLGFSHTALEAQSLTVSEAERYRSVLPGEADLSGRLDEAILSLRQIKSPGELGHIREAQRLTDEAFLHILSFIRPGVTEREIALELEFFMRRNGAHAASFDIIAVSGIHSSMPHGVPTDKAVEPGDFVTMDFGAEVDGYLSDMTRTVAVGMVSEQQRLVYETVLKAQLAALRTIRAGVTGHEADAAARDVIEAAGFGSRFGHATGHSVGLEIHEEPRCSPNAGAVLQPGVIMTVEPGIYLEGNFGVRIEDMVAVTQEGCENLTKSSKELLILS